MKPTISTISVPVGTEISRHLVGADFKDCYALAIASDAPFALAIFLSMVAKTPAWVNHLMAIRNRAVALVGLKDLGHLGAINPSKPASAYRVGDQVGIFTVQHLTDDEVILSDSDKHLDVSVSVCKLDMDRHNLVAVSTVVHTHNLLGRVYMLMVAPIHKRIVPTMLSRAGLQAPGT